MGTVKSKMKLGDLLGRRETMEDLKLLPDELLEQILSWVPSRTLVTHCRLVCRKWRDLIDRPTVWKLQCERDPSKRAILEAAKRCPQMDWGRACVMQPFGRNLIKNPCGREKLQHWEVQHGGNGWKVEGNREPVEGAEAQTCFASSYGWCEKSQVIDLLKEGLWEELLDTHQPDILVSDWWGAREDCGCVYKIEVHLLAFDRTSAIASFSAEPDAIPQWNDAKYQQISHVFQNYGPGVRYVCFMHSGRDTQFWAGHYGARVTNSTVMVSHMFQKYGPGVHYVLFKHLGKDPLRWKGHYGARVTNSTIRVNFPSERL